MRMRKLRFPAMTESLVCPLDSTGTAQSRAAPPIDEVNEIVTSPNGVPFKVIGVKLPRHPDPRTHTAPPPL